MASKQLPVSTGSTLCIARCCNSGDVQTFVLTKDGGGFQNLREKTRPWRSIPTDAALTWEASERDDKTFIDANSLNRCDGWACFGWQCHDDWTAEDAKSFCNYMNDRQIWRAAKDSNLAGCGFGDRSPTLRAARNWKVKS